MNTRPRKPSSLVLYWHKKNPMKVTVYVAGGNKLMTVTAYGNEHPIKDACAHVLEGWFGTANREEWKYRTVFG